jgi:hypothetical protein
MLLLAMCVVICTQTSSLIWKFSVQKDQVPEDGDLSLKQAGRFMFTDNLQFYAVYVHMLIHVL